MDTDNNHLSPLYPGGGVISRNGLLTGAVVEIWCFAQVSPKTLGGGKGKAVGIMNVFPVAGLGADT